MKNHGPSDDQLIQDVARGGVSAERAATLLFDRHVRKLLGFFMRKGFPREDAEELLQETLIKFLRQVQGKAGDCTMGLFWQTARTLSIDHLRAKYAGKRDESVNVALEREALENIADEQDGDDGLMDCIDESLQAFREVEPERAETMQLVIIEEWGMKEVAEFLGRSHGATRQYVYETRKKLRALVRERCAEYLTHEAG